MRNDIIIQLNHLFSLAILTCLILILSAAFYMQIVFHELPCPLCLLQRVMYFGIGFGIMLNLRFGYSMRHEGLILFTTIILLIISTRQTLLDIYPRPGHEYIGSAILGLHMPVWSIVISVMLILVYALRFIFLGYGDFLYHARLDASPRIAVIAHILIGIMLILCVLNLVSTFFQCGFEACHTFSYRLLSSSR